MPKNPIVYSTFKRIAISAVLFFTCYVAVMLMYNGLVTLLTLLQNFEPVFTYNEIKNLPKLSKYWSKNRIVYTFATPPMLIFILGYFLLLKSKIRQTVRFSRFAAFWFSLVCINFFITQLVACSSYHIDYEWGLYQGFANVFAWFYAPWFVSGIFSVAGLVLTFFWGRMVSKRFFTYYFPKGERWEEVQVKNAYFFEMFFAPILLATVPIMLLANAYSFPLHLLMLLTLLLSGLGMIMGKKSTVYLESSKTPDVFSF